MISYYSSILLQTIRLNVSCNCNCLYIHLYVMLVLTHHKNNHVPSLVVSGVGWGFGQYSLPWVGWCSRPDWKTWGIMEPSSDTLVKTHTSWGWGGGGVNTHCLGWGGVVELTGGLGGDGAIIRHTGHGLRGSRRVCVIFKVPGGP